MAGMDRPELVVLDLGLPDIDGTVVLKRLREWATMPVLILSVRSEETEIIACLDAGADDYLVKPFRAGELLARVRTAIRHRPGSAGRGLHVGEPFVDLAARSVEGR